MTSKIPNTQPEASDACCAGLGQWLSPRFFKALGDPNRLNMLTALAESGCACSVGEIARCCEVDMSVVSRHLGVLRDAGILTSEKRGKQVFYQVRTLEVVRVLRGIADALEACCGTQTCTIVGPAKEEQS